MARSTRTLIACRRCGKCLNNGTTGQRGRQRPAGGRNNASSASGAAPNETAAAGGPAPPGRADREDFPSWSVRRGSQRVAQSDALLDSAGSPCSALAVHAVAASAGGASATFPCRCLASGSQRRSAAYLEARRVSEGTRASLAHASGSHLPVPHLLAGDVCCQ